VIVTKFTVQAIAAVSKVVPSSVLCALTDFYVCFAFSALSQEEKFRHGGFFLVWF